MRASPASWLSIDLSRYQPEDRLMARRVSLFGLIGSVCLAVLAILNFGIGSFVAAGVDLVGALGLFACRVGGHRATDERGLRRATAGILGVVLFVAVALDVLIPGITMYWLACIPLAAAYLVDAKAAKQWTAACIAGVIGASVAVALGSTGQVPDPMVVVTNAAFLSLFLVTICALAIASRLIVDRYVAEVETHRVEAETARDELAVLNQELEERVRERTARLAQALQDAKEAARAKAVLMANLTHEFRTPLTGVLGMTDLLGDTDLSGEQREFVRALKASGNSLLLTLEGILDVVHIQAGELQLGRTAFDPADVIERVVEEHGATADSKGLVLEVLSMPSLPHTVCGDPVRVRQVVSCLVDNAVKFTEAGHVTVTASWTAGSGLHVRVDDTGPGFDSGEVDRLFAFLSQGDSGSTKRHAGVGVGLSLAARLVELMGGRINAQSEPGVGSTFEVVIPIEIGGAGEGETVRLLGRRVLVLADHKVSRHMLRAGLEARGAEVVAVAGTPPADTTADLDVVVVHADVHDTTRRTVAGAFRDVPIVNADGPVRWQRLVGQICQATDTQRPTQQVAAPEAAHEQEPGDGIVLVVEDNTVNQRVIKAMLEREGRSVLVAPNGRAGVDVFVEHGATITAVLMDCQMPVLDGYGATREIRAYEAQSGGRHVPIIAVTANAGPEDREKCLAAGMDDYIPKPVGREILSETLRRCITQTTH